MPRRQRQRERQNQEGSDEAPLSLFYRLTARYAVLYSQIQIMAFAPDRSVVGVPFSDDPCITYNVSLDKTKTKWYILYTADGNPGVVLRSEMSSTSNSDATSPLEKLTYAGIPIDSSNSSPEIKTPPTPVKESSSNEHSVG